MVGRLIQVTKSAYQYPLIFKQLWHTPLLQVPDQEIVYRDLKRFTYRQIDERIGRLASALDTIGVRPGDTVGVLDWDSHRFLEAFFAIPMMGAVLRRSMSACRPNKFSIRSIMPGRRRSSSMTSSSDCSKTSGHNCRRSGGWS